ncbi:Protein of unknown function [Gryllus bimaculatus]|nr:Protein of unknown function [Gryllus bimaculatus]
MKLGESAVRSKIRRFKINIFLGEMKAKNLLGSLNSMCFFHNNVHHNTINNTQKYNSKNIIKFFEKIILTIPNSESKAWSKMELFS